MSFFKRLVATILLLAIILPLLPSAVFAGTGGGSYVRLESGPNGEQDLIFQVTSTPSSSQYRYRTKGWHFDVRFNSGKSFNFFFKDSRLEPLTGTVTVVVSLCTKHGCELVGESLTWGIDSANC